MKLDPASGKRTLLAQRPDRDVFRVIRAEQESFATGVSFFSPGHDDLLMFEPKDAQLQAQIDHSLPGLYKRILSSSDDGSVRTIQTWNPGEPARFYVLDLPHGRMSMLGEEFSDRTLPPLASARFFHFTTRDGQAESGYILMPHETRGTSPYPTLLLPIDYVGQEGDQSYGFDRLEQFLASRGIAVARIVVRGSRGLGRNFLAAGEFKLADTVTHDYEDGLAYLSREGLVDPKRVAIFGSGRSALLALRMASVTGAFKAVIARDATTSSLDTTDINWLFGSYLSSAKLIDTVGGRANAASLVGQFDPARFIATLQAHVLAIYQSNYDLEYYVQDAGYLRGLLKQHNKPHEWYHFDTHDAAHRTESYYQAILSEKIAAYLEQQFALVPPPAR
jgi:hypothetical protein